MDQKQKFAACGNNVRIFPGARIVGHEHIHLGSNVIIDDFAFIYATAPVVIGSYVHIASFSSISGGGVVVLEDFSGLSSGVRIVSGSDDFAGGGLTNPAVPPEFRAVKRSFVWIGRHAIVGSNTVVLPGVRIGEGVAVSAGAVVAKDLEAWGIYAGSPARRVRPRPSEKMLELEQQLRDQSPWPPLDNETFLPLIAALTADS